MLFHNTAQRRKALRGVLDSMEEKNEGVLYEIGSDGEYGSFWWSEVGHRSTKYSAGAILAAMHVQSEDDHLRALDDWMGSDFPDDCTTAKEWAARHEIELTEHQLVNLEATAAEIVRERAA